MNKIAKSVKENDYFAMGLTDKEALYGLPEFVKVAGEINKPYILGETISINEDNLCLFIINEHGYKNLLNINVALEKEELNFDYLKDHAEGLIAVLETSHGKFKEMFDYPVSLEFTKYLIEYVRIYKENFFLGIEVTSKEEVKYANKIRQFANEYTYECVAFPRIRYAKKEDKIVIDIVEAIANEEKLSNKNAVGQEYFMKESDYAKIYTKKELDNTIKIARLSKFDFNQKRGKIAHFPCQDSVSLLKESCTTALKIKGLDDKQNYIDRMNYELDVIISMGYADYFLIVQDYVKYAKNHDIYVGPGRGSAAGALVSYLLDITEIDPLKYNLQFERFLNPARKTMPDIDVDFIDTKREEIVEYVRNKYGKNKVANIVTFQTILAKQAIRDIGRVYGYSEGLISTISKRLTGKDLNLHDSYRKLPAFKELVDADKSVLEIVSLASKIENLPRQSGIGAAGVLLSEDSLEDVIPVSIDMEGNYICNFEKDYVEQQGFLKMDFLALTNLSTIDDCVKLINARHPEVKLNRNDIPYDEPEIFDLIAKDQTIGLFQIETNVMRRSIKVLKPNCFADIVALLALGRPGPMQYIPSYAKRKEGLEKINYACPEIEPILKETYGIIVYQEQVNDIARVMAGFSMSEADMFRRAVSKKDMSKLSGLESSFINGCLKMGHDMNVSKKVFADILKFASYGFNKSHSVVYSVITCRMGWLKVHYPLEFYAALLQTGMSGNDVKFSEYIHEMRNRNIEVLPPYINSASSYFTIKENNLIMPLSAISYINAPLANQIALEREKNGPFKDFFDFVLRLKEAKITDQQLNCLIDAGAFDELSKSRASLRASVLAAKQFAEVASNNDGQMNLGISAFESPILNQAEDDMMDNLNREYEVLGIMISDNPLRLKREELTKQGILTIEEAKGKNDATVAGIIKVKKIITTKKGGQMAFVKIFDETDELEMTVFPKDFVTYNSLLERNQMIIVHGRFTLNKENERDFVIDKINKLED